MKITIVRIVEVEGADRSGMAIYESPRGGLPAHAVTPYRVTYTVIGTDEGISGIVNSGSADVKAVGSLLIGEDPMRVEYLWEKLYYSTYHQQKASTVGVLDLALWDIVGKAKNEPVYRLLGGLTRDRTRAYVGMLGFSTDPARAAEQSVAWVENGFTCFSRAPSASARWPSGASRSTVTSSISVGTSTSQRMATSIHQPVQGSATSWRRDSRAKS